MSFDLKNVGATYQCLRNVMFKTSMEVYINDMLVNSQVGVDYIRHLEETFQILR